VSAGSRGIIKGAGAAAAAADVDVDVDVDVTACGTCVGCAQLLETMGEETDPPLTTSIVFTELGPGAVRCSQYERSAGQTRRALTIRVFVDVGCTVPDPQAWSL